ncbi:hypothetical protein EST38_g2137 [Candolleomyces aberdarensis]|uniref:FAS1 domain-containing protein n=1 Tax=Candolleomyces aberdarensis TaxID=2316362 RepID=A0A4Q2DU17_9AGAR|nr:hypothetical protein EST38_g2137 [Candolleomyces aberdarensis]
MFFKIPRALAIPILTVLILTLFTNAATVQEVIAERPELSRFNSISTRFPAVLRDLTVSGGTLLAPNNDAVSSFIASAGIPDLASITEAAARDLLSYHVLPLALRSTDLSSPNVVFASAFGSTGQEVAPSGLKIYSGIGTPSNVTTPDVVFDDGVLNFPRPCTETAEAASLSSLLRALQRANLTETVDTTPKFTCFAPTDAAFQRAGIDVEALTPQQLTDALMYHSIVGDVGYSTAFEDGRQYQTLLGVNVTVHKRAGQLFINDVAVLQGNVIMSNGVAHVLDGADFRFAIGPVTSDNKHDCARRNNEHSAHYNNQRPSSPNVGQ